METEKMTPETVEVGDTVIGPSGDEHTITSVTEDSVGIDGATYLWKQVEHL